MIWEKIKREILTYRQEQVRNLDLESAKVAFVFDDLGIKIASKLISTIVSFLNWIELGSIRLTYSIRPGNRCKITCLIFLWLSFFFVFLKLLEDIENGLERDQERFRRYQNIQFSEEYKKGDLTSKKN